VYVDALGMIIFKPMPVVPKPIAPPKPVAPRPHLPVPPVGSSDPSPGWREARPRAPKPSDLPADRPFKKPWRCPGRDGRPDSDCPAETLDRLSGRVNAFCNKPGQPAKYRGCSKIWPLFWNCDGIEDLKNKWDECCKARRERELKCFRGGNHGHRWQIVQCEYQVTYCYYLLRLRKCPGYGAPVGGMFPPLIAGLYGDASAPGG